MKEYQKPEAEFISLVAKEAMTDDITLDGDMATASSIWP